MRVARPAVAAMLVLLILACTTACSLRRPDPTPTSATAIPVGSTVRSLESGGLGRSYRVHRPADLPSSPALVLMLHGGFGSAAQAEQDYPWDRLADREGFVMAYPDGYGHAWSVGNGCCGRPGLKGVDDVAFVTAVARDLEERLGVDPDRVYAAGFSNGAIMAYSLACSTDVFAAIGPVSGTILGPCDAPRRTSVYQVHGTADERIRYDGGASGKGLARVDGPSAPAINAMWRSTDDCGVPTSRHEGAVTIATARCADGRSVALATIDGYAHEWPSVIQDTGGTPLADETYRGWEATEALWVFFAAHPRV